MQGTEVPRMSQHEPLQQICSSYSHDDPGILKSRCFDTVHGRVAALTQEVHGAVFCLMERQCSC